MGIRDLARYCIESVIELTKFSLQIFLVMYDAVTYARAVSTSDVEMYVRERMEAAEKIAAEKRLRTPVAGEEPVVLRRTLYSKCYHIFYCCCKDS